MTGNKCLPDTSVIMQSFKDNGFLAKQLSAISEVFVSITVIGELNFDAYNSNDSERPLPETSRV